ncbi:TPA: thioredoxin domain-containing protein [Elizabethkingia anophelis]
MTSTNPIFQYLKKENININKSEFLFQQQSHPDFPKLLSIVDTLNFLNISAGAFHITQEEYSLLPEYFVTYLNIGEGTQPYLIKKGAIYTVYKEKSLFSLSEQELSSYTNSVFLLIEKENKETIDIPYERFKWISLSFLSCLSIILLLKNNNFSDLPFLLFSIGGLYLSVTSLKVFFGIKNSFIDKLCGISVKTNCSTLINSKKWPLFKYISFTDLSLLFFSSQILGLFVFSIANQVLYFFSIQKLLLYFTIPFICISLFYQKFIEKKWCFICLSIILVLIIELIYLSIFLKKVSLPDAEAFILFGIIIFSLISGWGWIKKTLLKQKKLQEFFIRGNRLALDYSIFKNTLMANKKILIPSFSFEIGNTKADRSFIISTNPFCSYCKEFHQIIEKIAKKNSNNLSIKIILNIDLTSLNGDIETEFCKKLVSTYFINYKKFTEALHDWFEQEDILKWNEKFGDTPISQKAEEILKTHHLWALNNKFQFTPAIFIDGFPFPRKFDREYLPFYIEEILEDEHW